MLPRGEALRVWKQALLHAGDEHHVKLQSLRHVDGHHPHGVAVLVGVAVAVGEQCHLLQIVGHAHGRFVVLLALALHKLAHAAEQRGVVVHHLAPFGGHVRLRLGNQSALLHHLLTELVGVGSLVVGGDETLDHGGEGLQSSLCAAVHVQSVEVGLLHHVPRARLLLLGAGEHLVERRAAYAPRGEVDDAPQSLFVAWVRHQPKVCHGIAHRLLLVE